jgi:hypothetical protein
MAAQARATLASRFMNTGDFWTMATFTFSRPPSTGLEGFAAITTPFDCCIKWWIGNANTIFPMTAVASAGAYLLSTLVELEPNAAPQLLPKAGAQRTL